MIPVIGFAKHRMYIYLSVTMKKKDPIESNLRHLMAYYARKFSVAEQSLQQVLPFWIESVNNNLFSSALQHYLLNINRQLQLMTEYFTQEHIQVAGTVNQSIQLFIEETNKILKQTKDPAQKDAILLASVMEINRYKINLYHMASVFARSLDMKPLVDICNLSENQEREIQIEFLKLSSNHIHIDGIDSIHIRA